MPTYKIENNSTRDKAIQLYGGSEVVKAGKSATIETLREFIDHQIHFYAGLGVVITLAGKSKAGQD